MKKILISSKSFFIKCERVWHALKKPTKKEFETITKVSAIGILALGTFGFIISMVMKIFVK
jgi:protein translocase SEC61 complex gamma subunit